MPTAFTKWFIDIVEYEDGENASNGFSAGPISFENNKVYTLGEFQTKVNTALSDATDNYLTSHEYRLAIAKIESPSEIDEVVGEASSLTELVLEYHIYPTDLAGPLGPTLSGIMDEDFRFKINFWSGPHGASEVAPSTARSNAQFEAELF